MTPKQLMRQQQRKLCEQFAQGDGDHQIGVRTLELFPFRGHLYGGEIAKLDDVSPDEAFVWSRGAEDHELWVKAHEKGTPGSNAYRTQWKRFCRQKYGIDWNLPGAEVNIDHLFPETAGSVMGLTFIRLMPIDAKANRAQSPEEKQRAKREREIIAQPPAFKEPTPVRLAVPETLAKATGFREAIKLPEDRSGPADLAQIRRLVAHVTRTTGLDEPKVLTELMVHLTQSRITDIQTPLDQRADKRAAMPSFNFNG